MKQRWFLYLAASWLLLSPETGLRQPALQAQPQRTFTTPTDEQIDASIKRGTAYLMGRLGELKEGYSSVTAMSLMKAGHKPNEPAIAAAINKILSQIKNGKFTPIEQPTNIYEAGVAIMALGTADAKKYKPEMEILAQYIQAEQADAGYWDYGNLKNVRSGDTSISQYAILGLWEATRAGITVPGQVWDKAAAWHIKTQLSGGAFSYHPLDPNPDHPEIRQASQTMTLAGTCNMQIIKMHLYPEARDLEAEQIARRKRGVKWGVLEPLQIEDEDPDTAANVARQAAYTPTVRLAAIDSSIKGAARWTAQKYAPVPPNPWSLYYLYALERMATLTGLDEMAGHDWYSEGTAYLVGTQAPNGSWADMGGADAGTALAALFLGRATIKMMKHRPRPKFGIGILKAKRGLPENLDNLTDDKGDVGVKKMTGGIDSMLSEISKIDSINLESAQVALEDLNTYQGAGAKDALLKQRERLVKLASDPRANARVIAFTVLGKTDDISVAPILINAIANDSDADCVIAAHKSLKFLARNVRLGKKNDDLEFTEDATPNRRQEVLNYWKNWYRVSRPYAERDSLSTLP